MFYDGEFAIFFNDSFLAKEMSYRNYASFKYMTLNGILFLQQYS